MHSSVLSVPIALANYVLGLKFTLVVILAGPILKAPKLMQITGCVFKHELFQPVVGRFLSWHVEEYHQNNPLKLL